MNQFLLLSVLILSIFSFLAVAVWSDNRRKEREAYYRSEALKKVADGAGTSAVEFLREQERIDARERRERMRVGGLVTAAASAAFTAFLYVIAQDRRPGVWVLGLIPLSAGIALLVYGYLLAPKES